MPSTYVESLTRDLFAIAKLLVILLCCTSVNKIVLETVDRTYIAAFGQVYFVLHVVFTARRICIAQTMLWQHVCLSVCPSVCHTPVFCQNG